MAVVGCFAAASDTGADAETVANALAYFGRAGEVAAGKSEGPGTFKTRLLDALAKFAEDSSGLDEGLVVREIPVG